MACGFTLAAQHASPANGGGGGGAKVPLATPLSVHMLVTSVAARHARKILRTDVQSGMAACGSSRAVREEAFRPPHAQHGVRPLFCLPQPQRYLIIKLAECYTLSRGLIASSLQRGSVPPTTHLTHRLPVAPSAA